MLSDYNEPSCYYEAMDMDDLFEWEQAMQSR